MVESLMPIYVLGAHNQRVQIPNQPLTVSISGSLQGCYFAVSALGQPPAGKRLNSRGIASVSVRRPASMGDIRCRCPLSAFQAVRQ
jgi:hypothetical protein